MIQPTALNLLIIGLASVVFNFLWRMGAAALISRNPDSTLGKAAALVN
jgi:hypothetical protein